MAKKESWWQRRTRRRAERECDEVKYCVNLAETKGKNAQEKISELEKLVATAKKEIAQRLEAGDNIRDLNLMKRQAERREFTIREEREFKDAYLRLAQLLSEVQSILDRLMDMKKYKTVIRIIPERTLHKDIEGLDKDTITKLTEKIKVIRDELMKKEVGIMDTEKKEFYEADKSTAVMDSINADKYGPEDKMLADLKAYVGDTKPAPATAPVVPVPADIEAAETAPAAKPTNKA